MEYVNLVFVNKYHSDRLNNLQQILKLKSQVMFSKAFLQSFSIFFRIWDFLATMQQMQHIVPPRTTWISLKGLEFSPISLCLHYVFSLCSLFSPESALRVTKSY